MSVIVFSAPANLANSVRLWCPEITPLKGAIIAGGFIRAYYAGETPSDMDLYFANEAAFTDSLCVLIVAQWEIVSETDRAVTLRKDGRVLQCVRFLYGEAREIVESFDFTICRAAMSYGTEDWSLVYTDEDFMEHLAGRVLVFRGSAMPLSSLKRMVKYLRRGYHICDENVIAIAEAIARSVDFDDPQVVERQTQGMDPLGERRIRVID